MCAGSLSESGRNFLFSERNTPSVTHGDALSVMTTSQRMQLQYNGHPRACIQANRQKKFV